MSDEALSPRQSDPLNILEPWRKVCAIDEDELVILFMLLLFVVAVQRMQEDATGTLRGVLFKDVITAWHTYMCWLYLIGGIRCPTKVYFTLSTLAGDSRYHSNLSWAKSSGFVYEYIYFFS